MFSPEVILDYYQLSWNNVVAISGNFNWHGVAQVLLGRENAWPFQIAEWHQIKLTPFIAILCLFICHNIEPTTHMTIFTDSKAGFIYHLVRENKIDLATYIYNQIHTIGIWGNRQCLLISQGWSVGYAWLQVSPSYQEKHLRNIAHLSSTPHWRLRTEPGKNIKQSQRTSTVGSSKHSKDRHLKMLWCCRPFYHLLMWIHSYYRRCLPLWQAQAETFRAFSKHLELWVSTFDRYGKTC